MFSPQPDPNRSTTRSVRASLWHFVDLAVALVTLESYGAEDLVPSRRSSSRGPLDDLAVPAGPEARRAAEQGSRLDRAAARAEQGHRSELRAPDRARRPGRPIPREQLCLTPLTPAGASLGTGRRRAGSQDLQRH